MNMAQVVQDNITFNNVVYGKAIDTVISSYADQYLARANYIYDNTDPDSSITYNLPVVNINDIDWCEATLADGTTINTAADLLNYVYDLKRKVDALKNNS